jgi:putative IMPACT (imprinted ancient) family translation regulator
LRGSGLGDAVVVVTRYFGGTKLGTGGLVRAYGDAVREVLAVLTRAEKIPTYTVMLAVPYTYFDRVRLLVAAHHGEILDEAFAADVTVTARFRVGQYPAFQSALQELTRGQLEAAIVAEEEAIMPLGSLGPDEG